MQPLPSPEDARLLPGQALVSVKPGSGERATVMVRRGRQRARRQRRADGRQEELQRLGALEEGGRDGGAAAAALGARPVEPGCAAARHRLGRTRPPTCATPPMPGVARAEPVPPGRLVPALWRRGARRALAPAAGSKGACEPGPGAVTGARAGPATIATPLAEVLREMNKTSNNAAAHGSAARAGRTCTRRPRRRPARGAGADGGAGCATKGFGEGDIRVDEGSGRSRAERGKPRALVELLRGAWRAPFAQAFVDSLPIAGVDGTLAHRMRQAGERAGAPEDRHALGHACARRLCAGAERQGLRGLDDRDRPGRGRRDGEPRCDGRVDRHVRLKPRAIRAEAIRPAARPSRARRRCRQ